MNSTIGFIACVVAGLGFGSNFIPVKQYDIRDGVFFQWIMCCAIWCVGLITLAFADNLEFHPLTMLGGALWCTGNFMCLQVIKLIGMSMGLMVWGITNSVTSWAAGKFGLFGLDKDPIGNPTLNYVGLALTVVSLAAFSWVKTNVSEKENPLTASLLNEVSDSGKDTPATVSKEDWSDRLNPKLRHTVGFLLAMLCGAFFGLNFVPPEYEIDHATGNTSKQEIDYVFSHFSGIFATSTLIMLAYCGYMRNHPIVDGQLILPAFGCGGLWALAQVFWFVAIHNLRMTVANPIVTSLPSIVAGFWGIVLFKEIQGARNLGLWAGGLITAMVGVILVALSK